MSKYSEVAEWVNLFDEPAIDSACVKLTAPPVPRVPVEITKPMGQRLFQSYKVNFSDVQGLRPLAKEIGVPVWQLKEMIENVKECVAIHAASQVVEEPEV
jgi:hypothetical protein